VKNLIFLLTLSLRATIITNMIELVTNEWMMVTNSLLSTGFVVIL